MLSSIEPDFVREAHAVLTVYLSTLLGGFGMGFSAVAIPDIKNEMKLRNESYLITSIQASSEELSWFGKSLIGFYVNTCVHFYLYSASILNIGQFFGGIFGGYLGGKNGPKKAIQVSSLIMILGWILLAVSPNLPLLIVSRLVCGFGQAIGTANSSLLVAQYR